MREMGLQVIWQRPNTSKPNPEHRIYPYLLRGMVIDRPNQVWCAGADEIATGGRSKPPLQAD